MYLPYGVGPVTLANELVMLSKDERGAFNASARQHQLRVAPPVVGPPAGE